MTLENNIDSNMRLDGELAQEAQNHSPEIIEAEVRQKIESNIRSLAERNGIASDMPATLDIPEVYPYDPSTSVFKGVKIVMVDNDVFETAPSLLPLSIVSAGNLELVIQTRNDQRDTEQDMIDVLADRIITAEPELVIMDQNLSYGIRGTDVVRRLRERGFDKKIVGSSGELDAVNTFAELGVPNVYDKKMTTSVPEEMATLARAYVSDAETVIKDLRTRSISHTDLSEPLIEQQKPSFEDGLAKLRAMGLLPPDIDTDQEGK